MKQIDLLEKVIKNAVKEAVREEISVLKEEVKKIKLLTAKLLKEASGSESIQENTVIKKDSLISKVSEAGGYKRFTPGYNSTSKNQNVQVKEPVSIVDKIPSQVLAEASMYAGYDDTGLPDIDVPVDLFLNVNNQNYHNVLNKINKNLDD